MADHILTGTWEEISRHAPELTGKTLCLTVLMEPSSGAADTARETAEQTRTTLRRIMARQAGTREPAEFVLSLPTNPRPRQ